MGKGEAESVRWTDRTVRAALGLAGPNTDTEYSGISTDSRAIGERELIVLGFDGLDYDLTRQMIHSGRLPALAALAQRGGFSALGTTIPPQSPVAWSTFITGLDPGEHGIFDFVHRDPKTMLPYLSTTRTEGADRTFQFGRWQVPLSSGKVELLRRGAFFDPEK